MDKIKNPKQYDLEERTLKFAIDVRLFVIKLPQTLINREDVKQVIRSSGSMGANYIEANESLGAKDFVMRMKICRKEAKETHYWLTILSKTNGAFTETIALLSAEAVELKKIFSAIIEKSK